MSADTITILALTVDPVMKAVTILGAAFYLERVFNRRRRPLKLNKDGLAPCPFCGAKGAKPESSGSFEVACGKCQAYTWGETEKEAVSAWNLRAEGGAK